MKAPRLFFCPHLSIYLFINLCQPVYSSICFVFVFRFFKYYFFPLFPEHQNHAREVVKKADLSQWDALVIMSGDGLLFEVLSPSYPRCY